MTANSSTIAPEAVLRIGVTGHRTFSDAKRLQAEVERIIVELAKVASAKGARMVVVSPLAEGADRIVARAALAAGARLEAPLPFPRRVYLDDFGPESQAEFTELLSRADAVFELDGARSDAEAAYEAVGRIVYAQSDVLIAIWDGETSRGRGGTGQIVSEACAAGSAVIWIDAACVHPARVLSSSGADDTLADLLAAAAAALDAPVEPRKRHPHASLGTLLIEPRHLFAPGWLFDAFRDLVLLRWRVPSIWRGDWLAAGCKRWRKELASLPDGLAAPLEAILCTPFVWADEHASRYAGLYRSAFTATYLLAAAAVGFALLGVLDPQFEFLGLALEFFTILTVVCLIAFAHMGFWHDRWVQYRQLAELLRPMRFLFMLGVCLPGPPSSLIALESEVRSAWIDWLTRRIERRLGLPNADFSGDHTPAVQGFLLGAIQEQIDYHAANADRLLTVERRLRLGGLLVFGVLLFVCFVHIIAAARHVDAIAQKRLEFLAGALPALGAALFGIRSLGEFQRLAHRSKAMSEALGRQADLIRALSGERLTRTALTPIAEKTAALMTSELTDWRTLVILKALELP